jgi:hypothetical protein
VACHALVEQRSGVKVLFPWPWMEHYAHRPQGAGEWLVVKTMAVDHRMWVQTAPALEGPWSEPVEVFQFPEVVAYRARPTPENVICYAVTEHPQFRVPGWLVVSYSCNVLTAPDVPPFDDIDLYIPKTVLLRWG